MISPVGLKVLIYQTWTWPFSLRWFLQNFFWQIRGYLFFHLNIFGWCLNFIHSLHAKLELLLHWLHCSCQLALLTLNLAIVSIDHIDFGIFKTSCFLDGYDLSYLRWGDRWSLGRGLLWKLLLNTRNKRVLGLPADLVAWCWFFIYIADLGEILAFSLFLRCIQVFYLRLFLFAFFLGFSWFKCFCNGLVWFSYRFDNAFTIWSLVGLLVAFLVLRGRLWFWLPHTISYLGEHLLCRGS